ncbi:MAG: hypothetical protein KatS3mg002_0262 [Candidatus Woesearchaeota archaeon]|nr:MAG: hypothetical protein KatS3mg002_0262 [Candidatus Woesearchaeota archaeon]
MPITLPDVIGLPPSTYLSDPVMETSFPVAEIRPSDLGTSLNTNNGSSFYLVSAWNKYTELLGKYGFAFKRNSGPLKVAFIADNFPSDSFSNEYQASFLSKLQETASMGATAAAQMFGVRRVTEALPQIKKLGEGLGETKLGKTVQSFLNPVVEGIEEASNFLKQSKVGFIAKSIDATLAGARLDFPLIWGNSSFQPSYTMTVRLYNPNPRSLEDTNKYIIGPLAALLLLGLPQSVDGFSYSWPFIHKVKVKGIWELRGAYISNITVVKGGDQQQIAKNQRLGVVDVRIDFNSLYGSIISSDLDLPGRTTLKSYLDNMREDEIAYNYLWAGEAIETVVQNESTSQNIAPFPESTNLEEIQPRVPDESLLAFNSLESLA